MRILFLRKMKKTYAKGAAPSREPPQSHFPALFPKAYVRIAPSTERISPVT